MGTHVLLLKKLFTNMEITNEPEEVNPPSPIRRSPSQTLLHYSRICIRPDPETGHRKHLIVLGTALGTLLYLWLKGVDGPNNSNS
jgi:hypothetical protein